MSAKPVSSPLTPRYERGRFVRVRPLSCNRRPGEYGFVVQVNLHRSGERALDKYIVQFADKDQEEFWGIQLDTEIPPNRD